jgi:hypothetical protein
VVATLQGQPFDIVADGNNIYWENSGDGKINKMSKGGGDVTVVVRGAGGGGGGESMIH